MPLGMGSANSLEDAIVAIKEKEKSLFDKRVSAEYSREFDSKPVILPGFLWHIPFKSYV
jgi:hypothetical protein